MPVLLASDFPKPGNEAIADFLHARVRGAVAWIAPGSSVERQAIAREQFAASGFDEWVAVTSDASKALASSPILYLPGGSPLEHLTSMGSPEWRARLARHLAQGGWVVGASGGAVALSANVSVFRLLTRNVDEVVRTRDEHEGLQLVPFEIIPHWEGATDAFGASARAYRSRTEAEVWLLPDASAIVHGGPYDRLRIGAAERLA